MENGPPVVMLFIAALLFGGLFYGPWQRLCVDWARQEMFEVRTELFRLADSGSWSFDSPEYRRLRGMIETNIRFAHHISWPRLILYARVRQPRRPDTVNFTQLICRIEDPSIRTEVDQLIIKFAKASVFLLLSRSLPLLLLSAIMAIVYSCFEPFHRTAKEMGWHVYDSIQKEAERVDRSVERVRQAA